MSVDETFSKVGYHHKTVYENAIRYQVELINSILSSVGGPNINN